MKKNLLGLLVMLFAFVSCEGDQGPAGPPGAGMGWEIEWITVYENDWKLRDDGDGPYYMCVKDVKKLNEDIYEIGNVFCYLVIRYNQPDEVQTLLPYKLDLLNNYNEAWSETISWDFAPGSVAFYVQYDDFDMSNPPRQQVFRVVMNW